MLLRSKVRHCHPVPNYIPQFVESVTEDQIVEVKDIDGNVIETRTEKVSRVKPIPHERFRVSAKISLFSLEAMETAGVQQTLVGNVSSSRLGDIERGLNAIEDADFEQMFDDNSTNDQTEKI